VVGRDGGHCIRTVAGYSWECRWTLYLKNGQINVEGPFFDAFNTTLAIIGGTDYYAGIWGTMKLQHIDANGSLYLFAYHYSFIPSS